MERIEKRLSGMRVGCVTVMWDIFVYRYSSYGWVVGDEQGLDLLNCHYLPLDSAINAVLARVQKTYRHAFPTPQSV